MTKEEDGDDAKRKREHGRQKDKQGTKEDDSCLATTSISAKLVFRVKEGLERDDEPTEESRGPSFVSYKGVWALSSKF